MENQFYVVMSGNVGNLPSVSNMDIQYAQSCILTPCDFPFARDGIAADTTPNVEMVAFADLRPETLQTGPQQRHGAEPARPPPRPVQRPVARQVGR